MKRILIVEDSEIVAEILSEALQADGDLQVVGVASDGEQAVDLTLELQPDLITMDIRMPRVDGLQAIERIMAVRPTPILVLTSDPRGQAGELAMEAVRRGALDLMLKPSGWEARAALGVLRDRVRHLAGVVLDSRAPRATPRPVETPDAVPVAIVASTGGPGAVRAVLAQLPSDLPACVLLVQHIGAEFDLTLARWLNQAVRLPVGLARDRDQLTPGRVLVAPQGRHMELGRDRRVRLKPCGPDDGHCPSGDALLGSIAENCGSRAVGVVLTGMGRDGADGLLRMRRAGAATMAQDEATSVVWGMPRAAVEAGAAQKVVALSEVGAAIYTSVNRLTGGGR